MELLKMMENNEIFSQSELIIRNYILNQKENIMNLTVKEIASINYVSKSTLIRFAQKLGFDGWNSFKVYFLKELDIEKKNISGVDYNFPFSPDDSPSFITKKLLVMKRDILDDTFNLLDISSLNKALELMLSKDRIHIFAEGYSNLASNDFCHRMTRIGKFVTNSNKLGMSYIAKTLSPKDLAIIVSYSGKTKKILEVAMLLKQNRIPTISITKREDNPISEISNVTLFVPSKENIYSKISNYSTTDSIRFILDILFSMYFNKNFNTNLNTRVSLAKIVDKKID